MPNFALIELLSTTHLFAEISDGFYVTKGKPRWFYEKILWANMSLME